MKFEFIQKYTFPVELESAVVTYLDCEHYIYLHKAHEVAYKIIFIDEQKCISEIVYKSGVFKWTQRSTTEYINKSEFIQYDIKIKGIGPAFLANFIKRDNAWNYVNRFIIIFMSSIVVFIIHDTYLLLF